MSDAKSIAKESFDNSIASKKSRDEAIVAMVVAGVSLNSAQKFYSEFAKDAGLSSGRAASRKGEALEYIEATDYDLTDRDTRSILRKELQEKFSVAEGTANDYIKAFAMANDIELPTAGPRSANGEEVYAFIKANFATLDKPTFREFMEGLGRGQGSIDETWRGIVMARRLMADGVSYLAEAA